MRVKLRELQRGATEEGEKKKEISVRSAREEEFSRSLDFARAVRLDNDNTASLVKISMTHATYTRHTRDIRARAALSVCIEIYRVSYR